MDPIKRMIIFGTVVLISLISGFLIAPFSILILIPIFGIMFICLHQFLKATEEALGWSIRDETIHMDSNKIVEEQ